MISGAVHACASPYTVMQWQRDPVFCAPDAVRTLAESLNNLFTHFDT
jgi:hypothetical protein